jgi:hypothetical protein
MRILAAARSTNRQTGDVPSVTIGRTKKEMRASCAHSDCSLFHATMKARSDRAWAKKHKASQTRCYAWDGTTNMAVSSKAKKHARGGDTTLATALANRLWSAKIVRISDIGDASWLTEEEAGEMFDAIEAEMLIAIGYVHGWRRAEWLKGRMMASCDTNADAISAMRAGWGVAVILPPSHTDPTFTVGGRVGKTCPVKLGEPTDCNSCLFCDGTGLVGFPRHDHYGRAAARARKGE